MAVIFRSNDGVVIDHALAVERAYNEVECASQILRNCRLKKDLFDIHSPFKMDSQCQAEKELTSPRLQQQNRQKKKRKRKYDMNHGELEAIQHHSEIVQRLTLAYNNLLTIGRQCGYFPSCPSCKTDKSADSKCNYRSERLSDTVQHRNADTSQHSNTDTAQHSNSDSVQHSNIDTAQHSNADTAQHSNTDTAQHSNIDIAQHSNTDTALHNNIDTAQHSNTETAQHSNSDTVQHSNIDTAQHSNADTAQHSNTDTAQHSNSDTVQQSNTYTAQHSNTDTAQHSNTSNRHSKEGKYISEDHRLGSMSSKEPEKAAVIQYTCNINSHNEQDNNGTTQQASKVKGLAKSTIKQDTSATRYGHTRLHMNNISVHRSTKNEGVTDLILTQDTCAIGSRHVQLDNNKMARLASKTEGPGDSLIQSCMTKVENAPQLVTLHENTGLLPDCVNMIVRNDWSRPRVCFHDNHRYIIPHHSVFMMSDFANIDNIYPENDAENFDLIVLDPPWQNKSVKRKKVYGSIVDEDLLSISLDKLASPGCLVVVWVTNKMRHLHFIQESLFPAWSVDLLAEWHWLKVTTAGEMVYEIASNHKKPYETLVIGRYCQSSSTESVNVDSTITEHDEHTNYAKRVQIEFNQKEEDANILSDKLGSVSRCRERIRSKELVQEQPSEKSGGQTVSSESQHCHLTNTSTEDFCDHPYISNSCDLTSMPPNHVIVSVPCAIHSMKPPLYDVLKAYLKDHPKCLELFARNLWPGVTSWGNEVLRHQHVDFFQHS